MEVLSFLKLIVILFLSTVVLCWLATCSQDIFNPIVTTLGVLVGVFCIAIAGMQTIESRHRGR